LRMRNCRCSPAQNMHVLYWHPAPHNECTIVTPNPSGDVEDISATALHLFVMQITVGYVLYRLQAALCGA
jgi:hypothetical protein